MKVLSKKNMDEVLGIICDLNKLFSKLNKETYHNLMVSLKYLKASKTNNNDNSSIRLYKTQIYSMVLALEDMREEIENYLEELNEQI